MNWILRLMIIGCLCWNVTSLSAAGPDAAELKASRDKAINFLKNSQNDDGTWTFNEAAGISALVTSALIESGVPVTDPTVDKALKKLVSFCQEDGRICSAHSQHSGYETAVALMALQDANQSGKYTPQIKKAEQFLRSLQFDESKDVKPSDLEYGGAGYGPDGGRPDLSNTVFMIEALKAAGAKADDPDIQKALTFVSRCQNLESEFNTSPAAAKVNDGGFYYNVSAGGASPSGKNKDGGLRSYGSMTYAGLKSMIYAGLTPKDPRVKAALDWIQKNYTVENNPGMGDNGLYYYYQLFAKALDTADLKQVKDSKGEEHDWRKELANHLFKIQQDNGSWVNSKSNRWFEGDPNLVTAYTLLALKNCEPTPEAD
ncbi:prenyltransferase/squalene oxidase repeat-containing protein [Gimesia sp.]|uniref:prenyltransferase/squalene oxidase repeat-containing protein n=1 Tax=Gimesia sp. TaxID=2024833 RepID=UPI003A91B9C5